MLNKKIFHELYAPNKSRIIAGFDSIVSTGSCSIGFIAGNSKKINAVVTETATDQDSWYIVNLNGSKNGTPSFDSVGVLGAIDEIEASNIAHYHFGRMFDSIVTDVMQTNVNGLIRNLDNPYYSLSNNNQIKPWQLAECQNVLTGEKPEWDSISILSHGKNDNKFLLDLQKHDDNNDLLNGFDSLSDMLFDMKVEVPEFDAIYTEYQYLDKFMGMLHTAMNHAQGSLKILSVETSKPFKRQGVVQIAVMYKFDDGQTLTVFFQNPDSTPSKLTSKDIVISWKYLLNKRDITGAVQPNQGEGISLPVLAGRLMKLVNLNSSRFARTQAKKLKDEQALKDITERLSTKNEQLKNLDIQIEDLKSQLDLIMTSQNNNKSDQLANNDPNNTSPSKTDEELKAEAEAEAEAQAKAEAEAQAKAEAEAQAKAEAEAKTKENQSASNSKYTEDETKYLNSIIDGTVNPLDADMDKIIDIGEKDESSQLFIDALSIIENAIDKSTALE